MSIEHWLAFGAFNEQRFFTHPAPSTYAGVLINANIAAYAPAGMASFLLERTPGYKYLIDPQTHAFQHDPSAVRDTQGNVRASIKKLADAYGGAISAAVEERRPLLPQALSDETVLSDFVACVLKFQRTQIHEAMAASDVAKYLTPEEVNVPPDALIAPYFHMTDATIDDWLPICVRSARLSVEQADGHRVLVEIVIGRELLASPGLRHRIADEFSDLDVAGYLLWVDDFDETDAGLDSLRGFLELAGALRAGGQKQVINMHGGYFSVLAAGPLGHNALTGVAHGAEYGEKRSVVPVGGGIPIARYYVPSLHQRVKYREALRGLQTLGFLASADAFHFRVCDCPECRETLAGDAAKFTSFGASVAREVRRGRGIVRIDYPTSDAKSRCLRHYLNVKAREFEFVAAQPQDVQLLELAAAASTFQPAFGIDGVAHLRQWTRALTP